MDIETLLHNRTFISAALGLGAFTVVLLVLSAFTETDKLSARLKNVTQHRDELRSEERAKKAKASRRDDIKKTSPLTVYFRRIKLERVKKLDEIRLKLAQAGQRSRDAIYSYLGMKLILPPALGAGAFLGIFVLKIWPLKLVQGIAATIFATFFGLMLPDILIKNATQKRQQELRKALPDALDLMVICAEAGLSLDAALDRVAREIGPTSAILAEEVGLTSVELNFLPERSRALQNLADRVPLPGVVALVNTLIQTEKYGTPLAQSLRVLSAEMRDERIMAAEAKAAKLPATLTVPMILFILPPLFVVLLGPAALRIMGLGH